LRLVAGLTGLLLLTGCAPAGLQFRNDHRLSFQQPKSREVVDRPVTLRWSMRDFDPVGLDGSRDPRKGVFAVFVDRAPMPVGKDLRWLFRKDVGCVQDPACPSPDYLADRDVYLTTAASVVLAELRETYAIKGKEEHTATVVLLDGSGRRRVESAWYRPFRTLAET
jgi:hypothetical protein